MKYALIVIGLVVVWSLWGFFSSRVEQAQYSIVKKTGDYEIRNYAAHIEAQTTVTGEYDTALKEGFRIIAGYIFGGNVQKQGIAMTAPVVERQGDTVQSQKIAMTAPVRVSDQKDVYTVSFVMPSAYTLESLPTPTDNRVKLVSVSPQKLAVLRFSWYRTSARVLRMQNKLMNDLARDGVKTIGRPSYAGYNAPWTPPWLLRNEVAVQVE
ncbi:MAG TPA: heme-binding protein [Candidatus Paceibacterota bacterium]